MSFLPIMLIIVVMATVAIVARNFMVAKAAAGTGKSRERAEREGDLGREGLHRAERRRRMR
ncbi:MAG TPA: hypothetical protein VMZ00_13130 [Sporichthya sp.]|nr:hypothetical protein [Sporichthya sp.]